MMMITNKKWEIIFEIIGWASECQIEFRTLSCQHWGATKEFKQMQCDESFKTGNVILNRLEIKSFQTTNLEYKIITQTHIHSPITKEQIFHFCLKPSLWVKVPVENLTGYLPIIIFSFLHIWLSVSTHLSLLPRKVVLWIRRSQPNLSSHTNLNFRTRVG